MKKVASIIAVVVMTMGMFSCDNDTADNDDVYHQINAGNDDDAASGSGGSGGE
ncbi:hypothetical protein JQC67_14960 [Aurantibacter crassamenti]|uniref:hypothetical protein n=1 Tax=Aurantibacter crassamenti TaxID=1837375 RepID=UPI00193A9FDE|nr:hypothetical protein [Aurantibacter crassamenti]MBM1107452.1 hypothetical protein [Aurantibacter crassamenti]